MHHYTLSSYSTLPISQFHCQPQTEGDISVVFSRSLTNKIREESSELKFQLQQGDVVAFNNRRVLHGRTGYNPRTVHRSATIYKCGLYS